MRQSCGVIFVALTISALLLAGCGGQAGPTTYRVTGTVTQDGKPLADAAVTFHPVGQGQPAVGRTDASGRYETSALPGRYRVTVAKYASAEGGTAAAAPSGEYQEAAPGTTPAPSRNILPAKYADPATSGFEVEVKPGDNTFDFRIEGGEAPAG
ncbi:MAG: carboxypeptidase-like regulatory domain-containing protein [Thermoguttaceae bacterium]|nr:carboxypeptidase-like regulatory domain-containing protein [Thermoguttaceae bacterium]MDW8080189.1 carboxypeptidase-like regulatory domain-containing protein [Thermoguttaceae bacterium]